MPCVKLFAPALGEAELAKNAAHVGGPGDGPRSQGRARASMMARIEIPSLAA
jgi:hypothetical protein